MPIEKWILWDSVGGTNPAGIGYRTMPLTSPVQKVLWMYSQNDMLITVGNELNIASDRLLFTKDLYSVEIDFNGAYSLADGHYARFLVSSGPGGVKKLTIVSD